MRGVFSKVLSVFLSFAVLSGSCCICIPTALAAEEAADEGYSFFYDDFEGETDNIPDNWEVSSASENTLLSVETENGNKYLRLKATSTAWSSNLPIAVTKPDKVLIPTSENSKPVLLKLKARAYKSGGSKIRNILQLGVPSSYDNANITATNEYQLFAIRDTDLNFYAVTADTSMTDTTIDIAENTWCDVQAVIKPSNNNVEFIIGNESVVYEKKVYSYAETTLSGIDVINNITLKLMMANGNAYMDIDDVEIYILDAPTAQLVTDNGFLAANGKVNLQFSTPMNTETLNADTVVLKNEAGDTVECTQRSYDEKSRTYTIIPDENLSEGEEYTVVLADDIYAKTIAGDYVADAIGGEKSFSFEVTRSKSTDARLSSIMVNGTPLEGFDKDVYSYEVKLQYAENLQVPEVTVTAYDAYANTPVITDAQSLSNSTKIEVTAEDGVTKKTYTISFKVIGEELYKLGENLITNPGFEDGRLEPYGTTTYLQLVTDDTHSGSYAAKNVGRPSATTGFYTQNVSVKGGRTYLLSGWFKAVSGTDKYEIYPGSTSDLDRPNRNNEYVAASTSDWQQVILTVVTNKDTKVSPTILSWDTTVDYYIDDLYVGELKPVFNYKGENEITVTQAGESSIKLSGEIVNQFGKKNGVESAEIKEWRIVSAPYGISVSDDMLIASRDAEAGTAIIEAVFDPNYTGDDALFDENFTEWTHRVEITVKDETEAIPHAKEVSVSGTVAENAELSASYRYYHKDGEAEDASIIEWVYSDTVNGTYLPIPDANSLTYNLEPEYLDKFIRVRITPKSADGDSGNPVLSANYLYKPTAPTAKNVTVTSNADAIGVGDKLTGSYTFYDVNLDNEGTTTFRWLRYNKETNTYDPISGANTTEYTLTHDDADTQIKFEVTPVSQTAPYRGSAVESSAVNGPDYPYVQNVSIVQNGNIARVSYEYKHPNGVAEGDTIVKWYVNGSYSTDGMSITASASNSITVEVTPVASKEPATGTTVSYTKAASSSGGNGGNGGGGGGGGASAGGIVTIPTPQPKPTESPNKLTGEEANHWGAASIEWALSNNYMTKEADNNFCPELTYNREYFLTSLIKMVGIAPVEYKNVFSDINAESEFSKILQAAVDVGIISVDEKFYPERNVSREEVCKIVVTALSATGLDSQVSGDITQFTDSTQIGAWAEGYVSKMLGTGLMQGTGNGEFMPKGTLTKAQTATILKRLSEYIAKMKEGR